MKRILLAIGILALLLGACQSNSKQFKLTATGLPEDADGTYAYIYDADNKPIDSVLIQNGGFEYTDEANDTLLGVVSVSGKPVTFTYEEGNYTLTYEPTEKGGKLVRGGEVATSSFIRVQQLNDEVSALQKKYSDLIQTQLEGTDPDTPPTDAAMAEVERLRDEYETSYEETVRKYYTKGGNSLIDFIAFSHISQFLTPTEYVENYETAGSLIKSDKNFKKKYETMQAAARTDVGKQFVDYTITNPAGETAQLSSFREEGKYFLLDFFASWCGPCKRSMPIVSELEKKHSKILSSVSISVWENDEDGADYAKAVKDLNITWSTMQDANSDGASLYGIVGVPTFILFSPEGEIMVRTHNVDDIKAKLEEIR